MNEEEKNKNDDLKNKANHKGGEMKKKAKKEASKLMSEAKNEAKKVLKDTIKDQAKSVGSGLSGVAMNNPIMLKIKLIVAAVVILGSYIGLCFAFPQLNPFYRKPFKLKETAVIIEESKKIAKLFSANYYAEIVIDTTKVVFDKKTDYTNTLSNLFSSDENQKETEYIDSSFHEITIIGNGTTFAANDLSQMTKNDVMVKDSMCTISIKSAEVVNTVINPSDFTIFIDEGDWSPEEVQELKLMAVKKVENYALQNNILEKANERTKKLLTEFLKSVGFLVVNVEFKP